MLAVPKEDYEELLHEMKSIDGKLVLRILGRGNADDWTQPERELLLRVLRQTTFFDQFTEVHRF